MKEIMRTEVKTNIYSGDNCDKHKKYFNTYCDGDMQDEDHYDDIIIKLRDLSAGTIISVKYPTCPDCELAREDKIDFNLSGGYKIIGHKKYCECGFNWIDWIESQYS